MKIRNFMKSKHMPLKYFVAKVKEWKMANKKIWLGMLVMVLAFGMTVVGCNEKYPGFVKITNGTTFNIKLVVFETSSGSVHISDPSGIPSGGNKEYDFPDKFSGKLTVTVTVETEDVLVSYNYVSVGPAENASSGMSFILSGTSKETLKF
jgi:hypothetical protein